MDIIADNIIFSLQKVGGISLYWSELLKFFLSRHEKIKFIENAEQINIYRNALKLPAAETRTDKIPVLVDRFLRPTVSNFYLPNNAVFHSSYYRLPKENSKKLKKIITLHDFTYLERGSLLTYYHRKQMTAAIKSADGIICISEKTQKELHGYFPELNKPIKVIHHGVSPLFRILSAVEKQSWLSSVLWAEFATDTKKILYVGARKASYKNFIQLVEALRETQFELIVAGGESPTTQEKNLLDQYLKDRYGIYTFIDTETLNFFYNVATCLVYPSLNEGFGLPLLEALRAGCPSVVLKNPIPELLPQEACVEIKNLNTEIESAVEKCMDLKKNMLCFNPSLASLNWSTTGEKTLDFYKQIINE